MKKSFLGVLIILAVLVVVVVIGLGLFLDSIVKKGLETIGPKITRVSINVDAVNLSLLNGSAKVKGLIVGNPEGYKTPQAISIRSADVGVNPLSVFSDKIVVRSVLVETADITFEGGLGGNNLSKIMDNVNAIAKNGGTASTNTAAKAANEPGRKFEVDDLLITGAMIHVSPTGLGGKAMILPLPDIHLTNLGRNGAGITATELTRRVLGAITTGVIKAVANSTTDIGKNVGNLGKDAGDAVGQGVNKVTRGIGGLFKK
jgi:AsmA family